MLSFAHAEITRQYQALAEAYKDQGLDNLPLMRCYEHHRISQFRPMRDINGSLIDLDVAVVVVNCWKLPKQV
jgi:hypothetical protein